MMVKRAKHNFHCEKCASECTIYKKGKNHRVLVCPKCGVLATNPFSLGKAIGGIAKTVPFLGQAVGALEGFSSSEPKQQATVQRQPRQKGFDYVDWALK